MKKLLQVEEWFQKEETLAKVLEYCQQYFDYIDVAMQKLRANKVDNPETTKVMLDKLTGCYGLLKPISAIAETEKKNREIRFYNQRKEEIAKAKSKFSSAPVEREASSAVATYRRVRNIIQAYEAVCEKAIGIMQSKLKYFITELKVTGEQE